MKKNIILHCDLDSCHQKSFSGIKFEFPGFSDNSFLLSMILKKSRNLFLVSPSAQLEKSYSTFLKSFRGEKKARKPWKTKFYTRKPFLVTRIQVTMKKNTISVWLKKFPQVGSLICFRDIRHAS